MKTNITKLLMLLMIAIAIASCKKDAAVTVNKPPHPAPISDTTTVPEYYKIYSAIIKEQIADKSEIIVIKETTLPEITYANSQWFIKRLNAEFPDIDATIFNESASTNGDTVLSENKFRVENRKIILEPYDSIYFDIPIEQIDPFWGNLYETYPVFKGIIEFSKVGINKNNTQAILERTHRWATRGGNVSILYLVKENNTWTIKKEIITITF